MKRFWAFYGILPVALLSLLFSFKLVSSTAAAPGIQTAITAVKFEVVEDAIDPNVALVRVNQERTSHGLDQLQSHEMLGKIAQTRANDMASRSYYAHKDPDGNFYYDFFDSFGITPGYTCENLDLVFAPNLEQVIDEWNASVKGHRECMMNSRTTFAGYGSAKLTLVNYNGIVTTAYVIVAIHAEQL